VIRQRALSSHTCEAQRVFQIARELWRENWKGGPLRLIGVTVSDLEAATEASQTELFETHRRDDRLNHALDQVRDKLGEASIVPAGSLSHMRTLGHVPFGMRPAPSGRTSSA